MGWGVVGAMQPLLRQLAPGGLMLLVAGGLAYTLGVVFYVWRRPFFHAVWHLFVLGGSICHFFAVFLYVLP
jgi:hemolysin III